MQHFEFGPRRQDTEVKYAMWIGAVVAWFGVIVTNVGNVLDIYPRESGKWPGLYGHSIHGWAGAGQRFIEGLSYFTMISNIMVALAFTMLALSLVRTRWRVALVDTSLVMITVTSIVFLTAILPYIQLSGLALLTSPWQHVVVPVTTWAIWGAWGPRGFYAGDGRARSMARTLIIPALWAAWMLIYGAFTHYYPYGFVNVNELGYGRVFISLAVVVLLGLLLELLLGWIDKKLTRSSKEQ
ncbi:hypothetical protein EJ419_03990 [Alloscardovia theropitheci]|uniref:Uncharacterized protein n=1 Tax=Alloscardovia theropitheci TaxID=2496842 RepID=A0A4R0QPP1_9BIFI|nr:Pr6Pr family membrane protein [Alloscardovia theropitheci]TCD54212.1 hypothetical protein EJ419_03990 [Alloscardovia theropitheci]